MQSTTPRLLITDDDRDYRETLQAVFQPRGFYTRLASDGREAVEIVRGERIDLVLIDRHMPRLDGLAAIRQIKRFDAHLPCILISADVDAELRCGLTEVFRVLSKPVCLRELTESVAQALQRRLGA